jgi:feruloyl esterase
MLQTAARFTLAIARIVDRLRFGMAILFAVIISVGSGVSAQAATCGDLGGAKLPDVSITSAQSIPAGAYQPPGNVRAFADLPAFCRVVAIIHPVPDSSIGIEVWLPVSGWNGRYQQVGNHGSAGVIQWGEMAPQLRRGFAVGATDDGHILSPTPAYDLTWAYGHPAKFEDQAWRAVHKLAENAKLLIAAYYAEPPRWSYFNACSNGGREGMREAQDFPADFDGILAGSASVYRTGAAASQLSVSMNLLKAGIQGPRGTEIMGLAQASATKACDAADGVVDGVIGNPTRCRWDPHVLICKAGAKSDGCITSAQADALAANIRPVRDPVSHKWIMGGMSPGSEFDQVKFKYTEALSPYAVAHFALGLNNVSWDPSTFNLHADFPQLLRVVGVADTLKPDLGAFEARGGKLIQYHGWDDAAFTPAGTVRYFDQVVATVGRGKVADVQKFYRLFMLPGVGHCGSGPGPYNFGQEREIAVSNDPEHDVVSALMEWVEHGAAPQKLIATKFKNNDPKQGVQMQRPIFPYPLEAVWNGSGDTNDAANFHPGAVAGKSQRR